MADIRVRTSGEVNHVIGHIKGLPQRLQYAIIEGTAEATDILYRHAYSTIRKRTGETARTIQKSVRPTTRGAHGEVWSDSLVAEGLDKGVPPHDIVARPGGSLRFEKGGRIIFAKRVHHPGYAGDRWVARSAEAADEEVARLYNSRIERALS